MKIYYTLFLCNQTTSNLVKKSYESPSNRTAIITKKNKDHRTKRNERSATERGNWQPLARASVAPRRQRSVEPTALYGIHRHLARFARSRAAFGQAALISLFIAEAFDLPIGHYSLPPAAHRQLVFVSNGTKEKIHHTVGSSLPPQPPSLAIGQKRIRNASAEIDGPR